ncbi:MAG: hypothetical protein LBF82_00755 [Lactobacillales bacterium]|jgi:hypothetical protein|nr:hypothetical protein [Lactobacillales bacterium]
MKKYLFLISCIFAFLCSFDTLVSAMSEETKNSIYIKLPDNSWIREGIASTDFGRGCTLSEDWAEKGIIGWKCIDDEGAINIENVNENFIATTSINLNVPIISEDEEDRGASIVASFTFNLKTNSLICSHNISEILNSEKQPNVVSEFRFMNIIGSLDNYDEEFTLMNREKEANREMNFEEAKIIPISMGLHRGGYALIPNGFVSLNDAWFWCSCEFSKYERNKFYKLSEVLRSHCSLTKIINERRTR